MSLKIRNRIKAFLNRDKKFILHKYTRKDGSFDYEKYKNIQEAGNKRKIDASWVVEEEIRFLSNYLNSKINDIDFGICHGTRQGLEQKWFSKNLNSIQVIGTEISKTAKDFPNTIQWDFHDNNSDWIGKADFIYSNSFDHSYNPEKAINTWMKTLKPGGICIIEHTQCHEPSAVNELDPFGATLDIMPYLVLIWSKGNFSVREIITSPHDKKEFGKAQYLILKNNY
jgi:SAM-dependent methyltransferase